MDGFWFFMTMVFCTPQGWIGLLILALILQGLK